MVSKYGYFNIGLVYGILAIIVRLCTQSVLSNLHSNLSNRKWVPRIYGGTEAKFSKWPFIVSIRNKGEHYCTGTLWSSQYIVTSAFCMTYYHQIDEKTDIFLGHGNIAEPDQGFIVQIEKAIPHEKWNNEKSDYDIGVLKLKEKLDFNGKHSKLKCACLLLDTRKIHPSECSVLGWGETESGKMSDVLLEVQVPMDETCKNNSYSKINPERFVCAGAEGKGACNGDTGSGLFCRRIHENDRAYTFKGVISYSNGCGSGDYPGVYTKLPYYRAWLKDNTGCG